MDPLEAVRKHDFPALRALLDGGAPCSEADHEGASPVWLAAWTGQADAVRALVEAGADLDAHQPGKLEKRYGIHIWRGLREGADRSLCGRSTLLHAAVAGAAAGADTLDALLQAGIPADARDEHGNTPLHLAIWHRRPSIAEALLARGADADACDAAGHAALDHAHFDLESMRLLLAAGASPDGGPRTGRSAYDYYAWTLLTQAAAGGHTAALEALLEAGADARAHPQAVLEASSRGHAPALRRLLAAGADPEAARGIGYPPHGALEAAAANAQLECVKILADLLPQDLDLALTAAVQSAAQGGYDPTGLRAALRQEVVRLLLEKGARPEAALPAAAALEEPLYLDRLLAAGAPADAEDAEGRTALWHAARHARTRTLRRLLEKGADPSSPDAAGVKPFDAVQEQPDRPGDARVARMLLRDAGGAPPLPQKPPPPPKPAPGVRVATASLGEGVIREVRGDKLVVRLDSGAEKTLLAKFVTILPSPS